MCLICAGSELEGTDSGNLSVRFPSSKDVALLSVIVIVQQSSSFVFAWLCIVLRFWLLLLLLFG